MPAYYEDYLKEQYPDEYANPLKAFEAVGQTADFPEMSRLLKQVEAYRGNGISAGLFYEGKVAEAISLIVEWGRLQQQRKEVRKKLSVQDVQQLENLTLYLNDHCIQDIPLEQIVRISCMSARKLQTAFKEYHGCTITEYVQQRRMSQAETPFSENRFIYWSSRTKRLDIQAQVDSRSYFGRVRAYCHWSIDDVKKREEIDIFYFS